MKIKHYCSPNLYIFFISSIIYITNINPEAHDLHAQEYLVLNSNFSFRECVNSITVILSSYLIICGNIVMYDVRTVCSAWNEKHARNLIGAESSSRIYIYGNIFTIDFSMQFWM